MDNGGTSSADEPPPAARSANITAPSSSHSLTDMNNRSSRLHLLVVANGSRDTSFCQTIAIRLSKDPKIAIRVIVDDATPRLNQALAVELNYSLAVSPERADGTTRSLIEMHRRRAVELVEWADLMVLCPIDADHLAKMMGGHSDTMILEVLRSWDASKRILLVPGMSTTMWENPVTKRQMSKLHRKWHWVRVLPPILWRYEHADAPPYFKRVVEEWSGLDDVLGIVKNQADLLTIKMPQYLYKGILMIASPRTTSTVRSAVSLVVCKPPFRPKVLRSKTKTRTTLPPEIWGLILEHTNDWELAQSLGVFTTLEMPTSQGWRLAPKDPSDPLQVFMHQLEWKLLTADTAAVCRFLEGAPANLTDLSALAIKLIFKFALIGVLTYIEGHCPIVFRNFDGKTVPTKASAYYGRTDILDWWARSPSFLEKQYDTEAMDGASRNGYVHVLEWWRRSGLPLKYTEAALEQASARGHLRVLDWWRQASTAGGSGSGSGSGTDGNSEDSGTAATAAAVVVPKPGRSLTCAAQTGQTEVLRWWMASGMAVEHLDGVCMKASQKGRADVLETWRQLRGDDDIIFNAQVLVEPTVHSYIDVLEWWRLYARGELPGMGGRPAKKVEYRTMDIEEALEDSLGDQTRVRRWWAENGLNLGLGTSEWMKPRYL
ncbi:phosphopantothenoylcysteine decarboxylase [Magnaporthiopsis poae ATCC 64411]|uniref:Phosphopantothenoylcysteine decarboxylase n=1 Tax=Magnaporthiopsis poae (strain ATCC 64411 / 73-15) TaxID=644358 RepID=A0A0C4E4W0_MAGP6|nr:phosphopantothenoylcysteine decarboxylase [Magnaporthiopsis poae ATCC 64411]